MLCFSNSLCRFAPRPSYLRGTVFFFSSTPPLSLEEVAFMPEESGKFSNSLPLAGTPSYLRGRVFDLCRGSLKYFVVFFQLPPSLCSSSLLSKRDSFLFSSTPPLNLEEVAFMPEESDFLMSFLTPSPLRVLPLT